MADSVAEQHVQLMIVVPVTSGDAWCVEWGNTMCFHVLTMMVERRGAGHPKHADGRGRTTRSHGTVCRAAEEVEIMAVRL
jgi:hypothetical protein